MNHHNNLNVTSIDAVDIPDSWFQLISSILTQGRRFKIDKGSYAGETRIEFDYITVRIREPYLRDIDGWPLIPIMPEGMTIPPPTTTEYLSDYVRYIMTPAKETNEQYTYGERLWSAIDISKTLEGPSTIDQVDHIIKTYRNNGYRNNQMVLQISQPSDLLIDDPPCLRHIDTRIQDGKLHFYIYFRSWDLWGGYPSNLAGISILQEYMATEIGVESGEFIVSSKGLHLYKYVEELAKMRCHIIP